MGQNVIILQNGRVISFTITSKKIRRSAVHKERLNIFKSSLNIKKSNSVL